MRIFITGATGLLGRRLVGDRLQRADELVVLSRDGARARRLLTGFADGRFEIIEGDPSTSGPWQAALDGCDAVVHLAGAGVGDRRWSSAYKQILVDSRVDSTRQIVRAMDASARRPFVLVNASAVGYYGPCDDAVDETAPPGNDFLAGLCVQWEAAAREAASDETRVVVVRLGIVLDARAPALAKMVRLFRIGLGGPLGSGRQWMPWIHWRDVVGLIDLALRDEQVKGPLNAVAPEAISNRAFSRALGGALGRPSWLPAPRFGLRLAVGELAAYMTMSQLVSPAAALDRGYDFTYPRLQPALEELLKCNR